MRKRLLDALCWLGVFLCAGILSAFLSYPAWAQEVEFGTGLVCDEAAQVEQFIVLRAELPDAEAAVAKVNNGTNACGVLPIAFIRGEKKGEARNANGSFDIVEVMVVGISNGPGFIRVPPIIQYTFFRNEEKGA